MIYLQIAGVWHAASFDPNDAHGYNGAFVYPQVATVCGLRMPADVAPEQHAERGEDYCHTCAEHEYG